MLKTSWFNALAGEAERALEALPESELCPHEAHRRLLAAPRREGFRIALVSEDGTPVALTGLVRRGRLAWEPISNWLFPGPGFPARADRHIEALAALGHKIPVAWWRMPTPPPEGPHIRDLAIDPVYRMDDLAGREEFWRSTDYLRTVKRIRNRARRLEVRVGVPEIAEQVVAGWHEKWNGGTRDDFAVRSRVILAECLEPLGRHLTVGLFDDGELAAGATSFVHRGALVAGVLYVRDEYRHLGAGVRLIDAVFTVAEERGLSGIDLGGGAEYKKKWAPASGQKAQFSVLPPRVRLVQNVVDAVRKLVGTVAERRADQFGTS